MKTLCYIVIFTICCVGNPRIRAGEIGADAADESSFSITAKPQEAAVPTAPNDFLTTTAIADASSAVTRQDSTEGDVPEDGENEEDTLVLQDLRPAVKLPHTWVFYTVWALVGLLLLFLLEMVRRACRPKPIPIIVLTPYEQAIQDLKAAQGLMYHKDIKPFIIAITDAVRVYFSRGFSLPAPECTTEELLGQLREVKKLPQEVKEEMADFLQQCDLAKFTKQKVEDVAADRLYSQAKHIVKVADQALQPTEEPTVGGADAKLRV